MGLADLMAGLAAVAAGAGGFARHGAPFVPPWRLGLAIWSDVAGLTMAATLAVFAPSTLVYTPIAAVAGFSLWELALAMLALRGWVVHAAASGE